MKKVKNSKAEQDLISYAKSKNISLDEMLINEKYVNDVADIFYKHMPKLVRMAYKQDSFREFYKKNRHMFATSLVKS